MRLLKLALYQIPHFRQLFGLDDYRGCKLERLEPLKCMGQGISPYHHSMIFQNHTVATCTKLLSDDIPQRLNTGQSVVCKTSASAYCMRLMKQSHFGDLLANTESDKRDRVGMHERIHIRPDVTDGSVKRKLGRGWMLPLNITRCKRPWSTLAGVIHISPA
jgi:hypothetical protein